MRTSYRGAYMLVGVTANECAVRWGRDWHLPICTLRVCENRVLRRIFGLKGDEVMGAWRKLQSEDLRHLYSSPNII
jgi:hypothetical protein